MPENEPKKNEKKVRNYFGIKMPSYFKKMVIY